MRRAIKAVVFGASLMIAGAAHAAWPERPVTVVVPFAAGGIADVVARFAAEWLQNALRQPFVVENQGGGGGIIAAERVAKARPDGYTLISTPIFQITMAPFTHDVTFDPVRDFKPIAGVATSPFVITVGGSFPANTLAEFISYVKSRPGQLTFGSAGSGSLTHVSSAVFLKSAGLDMIHVPYRGVAPAFTDLLAGHIAMLSATPVEIKPYLDSGRVRPLAVTSAARSSQLPDVPAISETLKSPPVVTYNGLLAPGRTPDSVVDTIAREMGKAAKDKALLARLEKVGVEPILGTPQDFAKVIAADTKFWRDIVRELNLKSQ
jgi:tripartite-type tricarboxylate transporter receptor subunit TctC